MRSHYSLFQSHLDLAHHYWDQLLRPGDSAIDATCGKGRDTLKLCQLALSSDGGNVFAIDCQSAAIEQAKEYLSHTLSPEQLKRLRLEVGCHSHFPFNLSAESVKLIVYNLGYLPGSNKELTTQTSTTLQSLTHAQHLLRPGGAISITCYPGHREGAIEEEAILTYASSLSPMEWSICHHRWLNRRLSPSLLLLQKALAA
ncbi:class I SAM-dependent methyltransferase [Candidatus Protochlamydia phocaeensis]|uniref:class I SAM-dependent methyltransferase n=1 Tax=Candidatus Protochlamydia phocaeensis TaxID=1414722 RepID=UPI0008382295|nr:class I SAM-dependent methyltransferase [Candidatus Protochlamydia phocaeensis]